MKKGYKFLIALIFIIVVLSCTAGIIFYNTASAGDGIFKGVYIEGIDVGGMSKEQAKKIIEEKFSSYTKNGKILLEYKDKNYDINYSKINVHFDVDGAVDRAYNYGKRGNIIQKTLNKWDLKKNIYKINLQLVYDKNELEKEIKKLSSKINKNPVDASITFNGNGFVVKADVAGEKVNETKLIESINSAIMSREETPTLKIPVDVMEARVKASALSKVDTKISGFKTSFKPSDANRTENLRIALEAINGTVVMPGEVFSMNKTLGPRLASKGYKDAPIIVNNTVIPGLAGGICQVTSTVYNSALLANLKIVSRSPHGILVSYVGAGRDATISGNAIDFKFKNSNKYPIYINTVMGKSTLTVNFYGANEHPGQRVELTTEIYEWLNPKTEYIQDPTLPKGQKVVEEKPIKGAKSKTYKSVYVNGKLVSKELLSNDTYKMANGKIRIGTKITPSKGDVPASSQQEGTSNSSNQQNNNNTGDNGNVTTP